MKRKQFNFSDWVRKLRKAGFSVNVICYLKYDSESENYLPEVESWQAFVSGNGIQGVLGDKKADNKYIKGRFAVDNIKCFDKVQTCPMVVSLPCDFEELLEKLKLLGSEEGYRISNEYEYLDKNPFPYEVE